MSEKAHYVVGTSGYSFADWVGTFYPADTRAQEMFRHYVRHFETTELNYTFYRMPAAKTLEAIERKSPPGFCFWVKANQAITHEGERSLCGQFVESLSPLIERDKLAGVLLQFPQSFHRTADNRRFLADVIGEFRAVPLAVEFRHRSWEHDLTFAGLRERDVAVVVPDAPAIRDLFRPPPTITGRLGYLRLHSRDAGKWYAGAAERYDYDYSDQELTEILHDWSSLAEQAEKVYAFFNNCHQGQAARNAEAFRRLLGQIQ